MASVELFELKTKRRNFIKKNNKNLPCIKHMLQDISLSSIAINLMTLYNKLQPWTEKLKKLIYFVFIKNYTKFYICHSQEVLKFMRFKSLLYLNADNID